MSRAERRRKERQQRKTVSRQQVRPDGAIVDFVIYAGEEANEPEIQACIDTLPAERSTVSVAAAKGDSASGYKLFLGDSVTSRMRAAGRGTAPYIVFMDADCRLTDPSAIDVALAALATRGHVVGGLLADGDQVHAAGYAFAVTGKPYRRFSGWPLDHPKVQQDRADLQAVPFGFLATQRDVFRPLGLTPHYAGMAWVEVDYCLRVMRAGGRVVYDPAIRVETLGSYEARESQQAQLLMINAGPEYDEWRLL